MRLWLSNATCPMGGPISTPRAAVRTADSTSRSPEHWRRLREPTLFTLRSISGGPGSNAPFSGPEWDGSGGAESAASGAGIQKS